MCVSVFDLFNTLPRSAYFRLQSSHRVRVDLNTYIYITTTHTLTNIFKTQLNYILVWQTDFAMKMGLHHHQQHPTQDFDNQTIPKDENNQKVEDDP